MVTENCNRVHLSPSHKLKLLHFILSTSNILGIFLTGPVKMLIEIHEKDNIFYGLCIRSFYHLGVKSYNVKLLHSLENDF